MSMMEKMVADMLGISPGEMQEMLGGMQTLLKDGVSKLNAIHDQNAKIISLLEGKPLAQTEGQDDGERTGS